MDTIDATTDSNDGLNAVIPFDGSDLATRALEFARLFPLHSVVVLHVIPSSHRDVPPLTPDEQREWAELNLPDLDRLVSPLRKAGAAVSIDVRSGDVAEEIIACAADRDLIIMTTSGKGAAGRFIFGSVADRISRGATVPTLLIRANLLTDNIRLPARLLVPLDGSKRSEAALGVAVNLATRLTIPLQLVRAVDLEDVLATARRSRSQAAVASQAVTFGDKTYDSAWKETVAQTTDYLARQAERLRKNGLRVDTATLHGTPVFALLDEIRDDDLVVMTSHGQGGYQRWLIGSVAEKLVREATSPVLLVPSRR